MRILFPIAVMFMVFTSFTCSKNLTDYYPDPATNGVAIFSDQGFNLMTCLLDNQGWKTRDRYSYAFPPTSFEVNLSTDNSDPIADTLHIRWFGALTNSNGNSDEVELVLPVHKSFKAVELSGLQGQRIELKGPAGYVNVVIASSGQRLRGTGRVYFNRFHFEQGGVSQNLMAGLFDADLGTIKIKSGRFDHELDARVVNIP
ncbi:MAG: hypothetical protein KGO82_07165 [Bacteroidota bacterium]|nr:hypothetical protein [Bacteroidota bacterium]